jgi:hypothetical protein
MKEPPFPTRDEIILAWINVCHTEDGTPEHEESFWSYMLFERLCEHFPFEAFEMIKEILAKDSSYSVVSATGMSLMVNLIGCNGDKIIDQLEQDLEYNQNLKDALEGIYNQGTSDEVWSRIQNLVYTT